MNEFKALSALEAEGVIIRGNILIVPRNAGLSSRAVDMLHRLCRNGYDWRKQGDDE